MPLLLLAALLAQVTPVQPIVKGTGLPLQDDGEAAVLAPIKAWFAGIDAGDANAIRGQLRMDGGGGVTVAVTRPDGTRTLSHMTWDQYLATVKPGDHRYHERFTGQPAVEVDGDIAMVWGDYATSIDGKVASCGVDHVDMVRENGRWQVQNATRSQRTTDCDA